MSQQQENSGSISTSGADKSAKVWFITGASRGFGHVWAEAALERGDKVAATARNPESIAGLKEKYGDNVLTLALDVTNSTQVKAAVEQAYAYFGRLDIVFNNAGYSLVGTIEEASAEDIRHSTKRTLLGRLVLFRQPCHCSDNKVEAI